ncbi:MAG: hypothetical protein EAZ30_09335 [Betaproteobacteria bacterium]|nr:MAG: hypothetical protein EAZ30_09335 [Betaproteobacteria bacterium]
MRGASSVFLTQISQMIQLIDTDFSTSKAVAPLLLYDLRESAESASKNRSDESLYARMFKAS